MINVCVATPWSPDMLCKFCGQETHKVVKNGSYAHAQTGFVSCKAADVTFWNSDAN